MSKKTIESNKHSIHIFLTEIIKNCTHYLFISICKIKSTFRDCVSQMESKTKGIKNVWQFITHLVVDTSRLLIAASYTIEKLYFIEPTC